MNIAAIVAGGSGVRMGGGRPKQFLPLAERPIFIRTTERFVRHPLIDGVVIGMHPEWLQYGRELVAQYFPEAPVYLTAGGASRQETLAALVKSAKEQFHLKKEDVLVTHDAVRPFVTASMITKNIQAATEYGAAGTFIAATDTIARSLTGSEVSEMPERAQMFQAQTPQSFRLYDYECVVSELSKEELSGVTDACGLFFLRNRTVHMVPGDSTNFKITRPFDYRMAQLLAEENTD